MTALSSSLSVLWRSSRRMASSSKCWPNKSATYFRNSAPLASSPKAGVRRTNHQKVQHLVVGEQDVRRTLAQRPSIPHQMIRPHRGVRHPRALADVQAGAHLAA